MEEKSVKEELLCAFNIAGAKEPQQAKWVQHLVATITHLCLLLGISFTFPPCSSSAPITSGSSVSASSSSEVSSSCVNNACNQVIIDHHY